LAVGGSPPTGDLALGLAKRDRIHQAQHIFIFIAKYSAMAKVK
jgi:hypothetical protein